MRLKAGRLRHQIEIQRQERTPDGQGGVTVSWVVVHTKEPADVIPLSGRELMQAAATQSSINTRIFIRYRDDVTAAMRAVHQGRIYNIVALIPDPTFRRYLALMCDESQP